MPISAPPPPETPPTRLEAEIIEILERADRAPSAAERARASVTKARLTAPDSVGQATSRMRGRARSIGPLALALILAVAAFLVDDVSPLAGRLLAIAAVLLIVMAIVQSFRRPSQEDFSPRRWRGRDLD